MLCRPYTKGRDWFDYVWYVSKKVKPNFPHLRASLIQNDRWKDRKNLEVSREWLEQEISKTVKQIDWEAAIKETKAFGYPNEVSSIDNWNNEFFMQQTEMLMDYLELGSEDGHSE